MVTRMGADDQVTLPLSARGLFAQGEEVDVVRYRYHLALWKRWEQLRRRGSTGSAPDTRRSVYDEAYRRTDEAVKGLEKAQPEIAIYLAGYLG